VNDDRGSAAGTSVSGQLASTGTLAQRRSFALNDTNELQPRTNTDDAVLSWFSELFVSCLCVSVNESKTLTAKEHETDPKKTREEDF